MRDTADKTENIRVYFIRNIIFNYREWTSPFSAMSIISRAFFGNAGVVMAGHGEGVDSYDAPHLPSPLDEHNDSPS